MLEVFFYADGTNSRKKKAKVKNGSTGVKGNACNTATSTSSNNLKSQPTMTSAHNMEAD
jgi:hypothetical protein